MGLTAEINNKSSVISKWFQSKFNEGVTKIIQKHNQELANKQAIASQNGTDIRLLKPAACYFLRKYISQKLQDSNWVYNTLAYTGNNPLDVLGFVENSADFGNSITSEAIKCLVLSALEHLGRTKHKHEFIRPLLKASKEDKSLEIDDSFRNKWLTTIEETAAIVELIPRTWENSNIPITGKVVSNATFSLSRRIGGADSDIIAGDILIGVYTTNEKEPFRLQHFYEAIAYCLLDSDDIYGINQLVWFYSRHSHAIVYPINKLFKDISALRQEFKEMIEQNYDCTSFDNNGIDLGKNSKLYQD